MRYLAEAASKRLGQPMVVVNKEGGGGVVALTELRNSKADGYKIGFLATGPIISAHLRKLPFDATKDFSPIIQASSAIYGMAVRAESEFKTMKDWIDFAAANPGKATYSTAGAGSPQHLVMIQLADMLKLKLVHVPMGGGVPAITQMLGGHVTAASQTTEWKPYVESGRVRLLALYTEKRLPEFPNVPTLVELGWNIVAPSVYSIVGPADMPRDRVQKLHDALRGAMQEPGYAQLLKKLDLQPDYADPEGLKKLIVSIHESSGRALRDVEKK
jgi:tripartite-type tricarboxylate transporter receptor subunit TctC